MRSRFGDFPDVIGNLPATLMPKEITTPGERQIRAFFVSAGNPVLSVPDGDALEARSSKLDLMVSLDFYVNETNRHADYVLPATTFLEREDVPVALLGFFSTPFMQVTEAVVPPRGEARQEWRIIDDLSRRIGVAPYSLRPLRRLARLGIRVSPRRLIDAAAAHSARPATCSACGAAGLSLAKVARSPHGIVLDDQIATGVLADAAAPSRQARAPRRPATRSARSTGCASSNGATGRLSAAADRPARAALAQLLDAQRAAADARRPHARAAHASRRRRSAAGLDDGDAARISSESGAVEVAGGGDRRDDAGHGRAAARLGPPGRMAAGQRGRRREREPARAV